MNRYAQIGLADEAMKGKRIVCVLPHSESTEALEGVVRHGADAVRLASRANGAKRVEFDSGGMVKFVHDRHELRGMSGVDVVFLARERDGNDPETVELARLVVLPSGGGVIRS